MELITRTPAHKPRPLQHNQHLTMLLVALVQRSTRIRGTAFACISIAAHLHFGARVLLQSKWGRGKGWAMGEFHPKIRVKGHE